MVAEQACPDCVTFFFFRCRGKKDGLTAAKTTGAAQPVKIVSQDEPGPYGVFINSHHGQIVCLSFFGNEVGCLAQVKYKSLVCFIHYTCYFGKGMLIKLD